MGAQLIEVRHRGNSMKEAYTNAVEDAIFEYGNDAYNGTISTTNGIEDHTTKFRRSGKSLYQYRDWLYETNALQKWGRAVGICIEEPIVNNNKIKTQVKSNPQKGARKWKTLYEATTSDGTVVGSSEFQVDAVKKAREYTERTRQKTYVHITKKLEEGNSLVSEITYKKSDKERVGLYHFIAIAAE